MFALHFHFEVVEEIIVLHIFFLNAQQFLKVISAWRIMVFVTPAP